MELRRLKPDPLNLLVNTGVGSSFLVRHLSGVVFFAAKAISERKEKDMRNYKTQMEAAKKGIITPEIEAVAKKENLPAEKVMALVAKGEVAIPANINHKSLSPEGVGKGLKTK